MTRWKRKARSRGKRRTTILLVEDDEGVRALMHDVLAERGFRVTVARDAGAALALLGRLGRLDLLVTDIVLPGVIDGLALAHEMRQRMPAIRILLTSGYAHIQRGSSRFAGQFDFLAKPFRPSQLLDKIEALRAPGKPSQPINQC